MVEFLLTLPVFMLLVWMIWSFAMHWWMQVSAATAVHDAVQVIAQGGTIAQGQHKAENELEAALGPLGKSLSEQIWMERLHSHRSVMGGVSASWRSPLSYWGFPEMPISARSFQRNERFYGGAPYAWE
jgi:hypothetical protein